MIVKYIVSTYQHINLSMNINISIYGFYEYTEFCFFTAVSQRRDKLLFRILF